MDYELPPDVALNLKESKGTIVGVVVQFDLTKAEQRTMERGDFPHRVNMFVRVMQLRDYKVDYLQRNPQRIRLNLSK